MKRSLMNIFSVSGDQALYGRTFEKSIVRNVTCHEYGSVWDEKKIGKNYTWMEARPAEGTEGKYALFSHIKAVCPDVDAGGVRGAEIRIKSGTQSIFNKDEVAFLINAHEEAWERDGYVQSVQQPRGKQLITKEPSEILALIIALENRGRELEKNSPIKVYSPR